MQLHMKQRRSRRTR